MSKRDFHTWLSNFRYSIADFGYYIDFNKVYNNIESIKIETEPYYGLDLPIEK